MKEINLEQIKVEEDQDLLQSEIETYISFSKNKNNIVVTTDDKNIMEWMINCPDLEINNYYLNKSKTAIIHLDAELPISYLRLKNKGTESMNYLSRIIS